MQGGMINRCGRICDHAGVTKKTTRAAGLTLALRHARTCMVAGGKGGTVRYSLAGVSRPHVTAQPAYGAYLLPRGPVRTPVERGRALHPGDGPCHQNGRGRASREKAVYSFAAETNLFTVLFNRLHYCAASILFLSHRLYCTVPEASHLPVIFRQVVNALILYSIFGARQNHAPAHTVKLLNKVMSTVAYTLSSKSNTYSFTT